jgi:hypothetical protein
MALGPETRRSWSFGGKPHGAPPPIEWRFLPVALVKSSRCLYIRLHIGGIFQDGPRPRASPPAGRTVLLRSSRGIARRPFCIPARNHLYSRQRQGRYDQQDRSVRYNRRNSLKSWWGGDRSNSTEALFCGEVVLQTSRGTGCRGEPATKAIPWPTPRCLSGAERFASPPLLRM